jgi:hypothetical protein
MLDELRLAKWSTNAKQGYYQMHITRFFTEYPVSRYLARLSISTENFRDRDDLLIL